MAQIKGMINAKGKSGEIIANNGAYFVDLTNATESSGTYTIPSADIENGDFTLQVGDTLIDKDSGSMLKVATLTPSITATLVFEASSGGSQLYQHNAILKMYENNSPENCASIIRISFDSEDSSPYSNISSMLTAMYNKVGDNVIINAYSNILKVYNASDRNIVGMQFYNNGVSVRFICVSGTLTENNIGIDVSDIVSWTRSFTDTVITL